LMLDSLAKNEAYNNTFMKNFQLDLVLDFSEFYWLGF